MNNQESLRCLRRRWGGVVVGYGFSIAVGVWILAWVARAFSWQAWAIGAALTGVYQLGHIWHALSLNHRPEESTLFSDFGSANRLTVARGVPQLMLGGFLTAKVPSGWLSWPPAIFYGMTIVADYFDGYVARLRHRVTRMGAHLDMAYDSLAIFLVGMVGIRYGVLPWWYFPVPLARYLFVFGIWLRRWRNLKVGVLPESVTRRMVAALQMGFLAVVMLPCFRRDATRWLATFFVIPHILSFLRDWGIVSGRLDPTSTAYQATLRRLYAGITGTLPLLLRSFILPVTLAVAASWPDHVARWHVWVCSTLVAVGLMGRLAAVFLLLRILSVTQGVALGLPGVLLLASGAAVLFLGTGPYTLWAPERRLLTKHAGST